MVRLTDLPAWEREHMLDKVKELPRFDGNPWVSGPPLAQRRVAVISTAGLHRHDDRPFAPGAAGNVPSEDVVYMLERAGISTGMDLEKLVEASNWLSGIIGRKLPGMVAQSPPFPKAA